MTFILLIVIIFVLYTVAKSIKKYTTKRPPKKSEKTDAYPDREFEINFLTKTVNKLMADGNMELANLNYAKLIESIRQQNVTTNGRLEDLLRTTRKDYQEFIEKNNLEYPEQFLSPTEKRKAPKKVDIDMLQGDLVYSENGEYSVGIEPGFGEKAKGKVLLLKGTAVVFKKSLQNPIDPTVSNDGYIAVYDWLFSNSLNGVFYIFNNNGDEVFKKKVKANLGICAISPDSTYALFETFYAANSDADKIFVINVKDQKVESEFPREFAFNNASINSKERTIQFRSHRNFIFETDFNGSQINLEKYEKAILETGTIYEKLIFYGDKDKNLVLKEPDYLNTLLQGLKDKDALYSFGQDKLYRQIGECYEAIGNKQKTVEYWTLALDINPKVGIKKRLDKYLQTKQT